MTVGPYQAPYEGPWYARDMTDPYGGVNYGPFVTVLEAQQWLISKNLPGYVHGHVLGFLPPY